MFNLIGLSLKSVLFFSLHHKLCLSLYSCMFNLSQLELLYKKNMIVTLVLLQRCCQHVALLCLLQLLPVSAVSSPASGLQYSLEAPLHVALCSHLEIGLRRASTVFSLCTTNCTLYFLFVHINVKNLPFLCCNYLVIRQLECYANSKQYDGDFLCMLCVIYLARNRCGFCFGGQITFKSKYNSLEFDELKQTGFLGPLITWGVWRLSAGLSEAPLYCNDGFTSVPF